MEADPFNIPLVTSSSNSNARAAATAAVSNSANPRPLVNQTDQERVLAERFRTHLCRSYERGEVCPYGYKCMFAHGPADLRTVEENLNEGLCTHEKISAYLRHGQLMVGSQCSSPIPPLMASSVLVGKNSKKESRNKSANTKGTASPSSLATGLHAVAQWDNGSSLPFRFTHGSSASGSSSPEATLRSSGSMIPSVGNEMRIIVDRSSSSFSLASSQSPSLHSDDALRGGGGGNNLVFAPPAARLRPVAVTGQYPISHQMTMMNSSGDHLYPYYDSHGEDSDGDEMMTRVVGLGADRSPLIPQQQHHHRLRGLSASGNKSEDSLFWEGNGASLLPSPREVGGEGGRHHDDSYFVNEFPLRSPLRIESGASSPSPHQEGVSQHYYPRGGGQSGGLRGGRGASGSSGAASSATATPHLLSSKKGSSVTAHPSSPNGNDSKVGRSGLHSKQPGNGVGHGLTIRVGGMGGVPSLIVVPETPLRSGSGKATATNEKKGGGQKAGKKTQQQQQLIRVGSFGSDSSFLGSASGACEGAHRYFGEAAATPLGQEVRAMNGHNSHGPAVIAGGRSREDEQGGGGGGKSMYHEFANSVPLTAWPPCGVNEGTPSLLMPLSAALPLPSASSVGDKGSVRILSSDDFENNEERFCSFRPFPPSHDQQQWGASLSRSNSNYSSRQSSSSISHQKKNFLHHHHHQSKEEERSLEEGSPALPPQSLTHNGQHFSTTSAPLFLSREGFARTASAAVGQEREGVGDEDEDEGEGDAEDQPLLRNMFIVNSSQHCYHSFDGDASRSYCAETLVLSSAEVANAAACVATTIARANEEEAAAAIVVVEEKEPEIKEEGGRNINVDAFESRGKSLGATAGGGGKVVEIGELASRSDSSPSLLAPPSSRSQSSVMGVNTVVITPQTQQQHVNKSENEIIMEGLKLPLLPSSLASFQNPANKTNDYTTSSCKALGRSNFASGSQRSNGSGNPSKAVSSANTIEPSESEISAAGTTNPSTTTTTTTTTGAVTTTVRRLLSARPPSLLEIRTSNPPSPSPSPATAISAAMHMGMNSGVLTSIRKTSSSGVGCAANENECSETAACSSSACSFATKTNTTTTEPTSNANTPHNNCSTNIYNKNNISTVGAGGVDASVTFVTTALHSTVGVSAAAIMSASSIAVAHNYHHNYHHQHYRQNSSAAAHNDKSVDDLNLSTSDATVIVHHTRQVSAAGSSEFSSVMACLKPSANGLSGVVPTSGGDVFASSVPTSSSSLSNNNNTSGVVKDYTISNKTVNIKIVNHLRVNASGAGSSLLVPPSAPPMPAPPQPAPQTSSSLLPAPPTTVPSSPLRQRQLKHHKSSSSAGVVGISEGSTLLPHHGSPACRPQFGIVNAPTGTIQMSSTEGCECDEGRPSSRGGGAVFAAAGVMHTGSGSRRRTIGGYSSVSPSGGSGQGLSMAGVSEECSSLNNTLNNTANNDDVLEETLLTIAKEIAEEEGQEGGGNEKKKKSEEGKRENECEVEGMLTEQPLDKSSSPLQPPPAPAPAKRARRGKGSKGGDSSFSSSSRPTPITLPKVDSIRIGGAGSTPLLHILVANDNKNSDNNNNNNNNNNAITNIGSSMRISLSSLGRSPRPDPQPAYDVLEALNTTRRGGETEFLHSSKAAMAMSLSMSASLPLQMSPRANDLHPAHHSLSSSALVETQRLSDTFATGGHGAPPRYLDAAAAFYSAIGTIAGGGAREGEGGGEGNVLPRVEVNADCNKDMVMSCSAPPPAALSVSSSRVQLLVGSGHMKYASASSSSAASGAARFRYDPYGSSISTSLPPCNLSPPPGQGEKDKE